MRINLTRIITYTLMLLSIVVLASTVYFLMNIKVVEDWTLSLPVQEIHVGDSVVVQSTYNKVREAGGESVRYIQCQNRNKVWIRYELNRSTANRKAGKGGTGIVLTVRRDIADVPTTCKFTVALRYDVLPFRKVYVSNDTQNFTLLPERTVPEDSSVVLPEPIQSSQSQVVFVSPVESSPNTTPQPLQAQSNTPQPQEQPTPEATTQQTTTELSRPSVVELLLNPVTKLIGGL